ncbi:hypothetical protein BASA82_000209 [Batrachochytrium salamandrivorans]|nr:hypothetical protein BASA82_000209 [Batrachochytrium salamandrivorans]
MLKFPVRSEELGKDGLQFTVGAYKRARLECSLPPPLSPQGDESQAYFSSSPGLSQGDVEEEDSCTATLLVKLAYSDDKPHHHPQSQGNSEWKSAIPGQYVDEATKRAYVLELTRRFNLTRRELSQKAGLQEDFRFMNYWLRGKELHNESVTKAGGKLYQWAKSCDMRVAVPLSVEEKQLLHEYNLRLQQALSTRPPSPLALSPSPVSATTTTAAAAATPAAAAPDRTGS